MQNLAKLLTSCRGVSMWVARSTSTIISVTSHASSHSSRFSHTQPSSFTCPSYTSTCTSIIHAYRCTHIHTHALRSARRGFFGTFNEHRVLRVSAELSRAYAPTFGSLARSRRQQGRDMIVLWSSAVFRARIKRRWRIANFSGLRELYISVIEITFQLNSKTHEMSDFLHRSRSRHVRKSRRPRSSRRDVSREN